MSQICRLRLKCEDAISDPCLDPQRNKEKREKQRQLNVYCTFLEQFVTQKKVSF